MSDVFAPSPALQSAQPAAAAPQARADRFQLAAIAVNRTRMPMVVTDPRQDDNPIVLANKAFLDLTGYGADEVVGRNCRFLQGEGTSAAAVSEIKAAIAAQREATVEVLNYRKNGAAFWNQLHISPIHDDAGQLVYFFASQDDVTEFRRVQDLEATERRLLKEVDHRARNVMAVVSGIVRLTRADDPRRYAAAIQQRIQALADAHNLLADRGWQDVTLEQVIRQHTDIIASDRVVLDGPSVMISASSVQPLALVLHELVVNATLHGALSGSSGTLTVRWERLPDPGGFVLRWQEADGPATDGLGRPGFGASMMRGMVEKQLRGEVRRDWTGNGLTVTITVPRGYAVLSAPAVI